jgi:two-component system, LytTR family, response regulator
MGKVAQSLASNSPESRLIESSMNLPKRILIVDDEALARQRVARYVRQFDGDLLLAEAESGLVAVEMIRSFQPEVIFLDIEMPGLNGFEVLQQFEARPFHVIFQTAYDQFAIRAFEEHACDYLLKPFNAARLHQALQRALTRTADEARLRALEAQLAARADGAGYLQQLTIKQGARLRVVPTAEIFCFVSQDHYTCVYFGAGLEGICELSLARLNERLDAREFCQLHRNNIVRAGAITGLERSRQGEMWVELANGMRLPVSRSHQRQARELVRRGER